MQIGIKYIAFKTPNISQGILNSWYQENVRIWETNGKLSIEYTLSKMCKSDLLQECWIDER